MAQFPILDYYYKDNEEITLEQYQEFLKNGDIKNLETRKENSWAHGYKKSCKQLVADWEVAVKQRKEEKERLNKLLEVDFYKKYE